MPTTLTHQISYPSGSQAPNVPVVMQTTAESVDAALSKITKAPLIICSKNSLQTTPASPGVQMDVTWDVEVHKQGITHAANSALFTVTEAGIYQLNVRVAFATGSGACTAIANVNGQDLDITRTDQVGQTTAHPKPAFTTYVKLNANDVVKIRAHANVANVQLSSVESSFQMSKVVVY